jgi:hypothetical protein
MRVLLLSLLLAFGALTVVQGQPVEVRGGPVQLEVQSAPAGADPAPAVDESSRIWYRLRTPRTLKITVSTSCPDQQFPLSVQARNVSRGTAQGAVALTDGMAPTDFIRDITLPNFFCLFFRCTAEADLRYRSDIQAEDGTGTDTHIVRYTVLAQ